MSTFKVGDRVRLKAGQKGSLYFKPGVVYTVGHVDPSYCKSNLELIWPEGASIAYGGMFSERFDLVEESLVGKRVKVTIEATVLPPVYEQSNPNGIIKLERNGQLYLDDLKPEQIEVLPDPIVLPTAKNAVIEIGWFFYILPHKGRRWVRVVDASLWKTETLMKEAENLGYRIVFEGEK